MWLGPLPLPSTSALVTTQMDQGLLRSWALYTPSSPVGKELGGKPEATKGSRRLMLRNGTVKTETISRHSTFHFSHFKCSHLLNWKIYCSKTSPANSCLDL